MDTLGWILVGLVVFPIPFVFWFGLVPLWVERRLRHVGKEVVGRCRNVSVSEGSYSTSFEFVTDSGRQVMYISPLRRRILGTPGEETLLVYDPASPWRRVRTREELDSRSEAWHPLWWLLGVEAMIVPLLLLYVLTYVK
ncbi:hypothetical protein ABT075_38585 [Streptomyces sp. NPDC002677]|uniref:hypothetical protein n=1 Tax=Streptomyces sp. NPDC002677 TaxID=3154774 RepID=UPI0033247B84